MTLFPIRRLMALAMTLLGVVASSWAGNFSMPEVANVNDVFGAPAAIKAGAQAPRFALNPVIVGDVDLDGTLNISDLTELIDALLSNNVYGLNGDVDGDGNTNISDVTELIDRLLSGTSETRMGTVELANAMNNLYRQLRTPGWSTTGNSHQAFGIQAHTLAAELMGDDMIMAAQGSGWFWYDALYNVKDYYTSSSWRSYDLWTAYYTCIAEANSIISQKNDITGPTNLVNYYVGQAYALRAYSYFMLSQWFARTYKGHESDPCVPLFTGTEFNGSTGQPRATVTQVYNQINSDITQAVSLLQGKDQLRPEHIGYAVALGLQARIALVKEDWVTAYNSAVSAINASGKSILDVPSFMGLNNAQAGNVMWGAEIPENQVTYYASYFTHMDVNGAYAQRAPKQISKWLFNKMSDNDARRAWWDSDNYYGTGGYVQNKFSFSNIDLWLGDYIYMRVEEMYLTAAEAACRRGQTTLAKNYLNQLMTKRVPGYTCNKTGTSLGALTTTETGSLLEEILLQRRIELWGEDGRIYTIRRLHQGFERNAEEGWPASLLLTDRSLQDPESYPWVMTIPFSEFMENNNMSINYDQNPLGDYPDGSDIATGEQNVSFAQTEYHLTTAASSFEYKLTLTRSTTSGRYIVPIRVINANGLNVSTTATFNDGKNTAEVTITGRNLELGNTYSCTLGLSPYDINNGSMSGRILTTNVEVKCENGNPAGQHISFESASYEGVSNYYDCSVWVTLTRRVSQGEYRATVSLVDAPDNVNVGDGYAIFKDGELTTQVEVYSHHIQPFDDFSVVLKLSSADIATAIPGQPQITSTTITFKGAMAGEWEDAGTCTFTDYTWDDGYTANNVPIMKKRGTDNTYCIISPLSYVYPAGYSNGQGDDSNWVFELNNDGSISVPDGESLNYWGYYAFYTSAYPNYCYVEQSGNTYDVHFLLKVGSDLYGGGRFVFTWDR